jgi:hypothetical protein
MKKTAFGLTVSFVLLTYSAPAAFGQTGATTGYTGAYAQPGASPTPYSTGPLPQVDDGSPGLDVAAPDGSTTEVKPVPCATAARETDGSTTCVGIERDPKSKRGR